MKDHHYIFVGTPGPCAVCGEETWLMDLDFEARLCPHCYKKEVEAYVEAMRQPAQDPGHGFIWVESGVSAFTGDPFCAVTLQRSDGSVESLGQLSPEEVRAMAMKWIESASAAEFDAGLFAELRGRGVSDQAISDVIQGLRSQRKQDES